MAMTVRFKDRFDLNMDINSKPVMGAPATDVICVVASDAELKKIQSWQGLPNNGKPMQIFFGDHAKYIYANW